MHALITIQTILNLLKTLLGGSCKDILFSIVTVDLSFC